MAKNTNPTNELRAPEGGAFPLPSIDRSLRHRAATPPAPAMDRQSIKADAAGHDDGLGRDGVTKSPIEDGARPVPSTARGSFERGCDDVSAASWPLFGGTAESGGNSDALAPDVTAEASHDASSTAPASITGRSRAT